MTSISRRAAVVLGAAMLAGAAGLVTHVHASGAAFAAQGPAGPGGPGGPGPRGGPGGPGGRMGRGPMGPGGAVDLPLGQLNLSAQQRDQVKTIVDSHQDELKALGDRQMAARQSIEKGVTADTIDEGAIRQAAADLGALEADMAVARAHIRAEVLQVLTPDQQKQAKTLEAERPAPPDGRGRGRGR